MHVIQPLADILGGSLGVAAVALVVGWTLLAWQRDRNRFVLMRTALEKGITRFPDAPPFWLVSMRQAVTSLAMGIALAGVGGGAFWLGHGVPMPTGPELATFATSEPADLPPGPGHHPYPPAPNPRLEHWHQAQTQVVVGLTSIGIGIILAFVGIVRILFARAEQAYADEHPDGERNV
jgi:hypothetical protein